MLWYAVSLPYLCLEWRPPERASVAVVDRAGRRRVVRAVNASARAAGVHIGLDATVALARLSDLRLLDRSASDEARALNALAGWAYQFSSIVCVDVVRSVLWLEVGGSQRYFGDLDSLLAQVREGLAQLGYTACCAVAPTLEAAALFAQEGTNVRVTSVPELRSITASRALQLLAIEPAVLDHLRTAGLRVIGDVLSIPAAALTRRFGSTFNDYLLRLLGDIPDPRRHYRPPRRYRRRFDCTYPIASVEALLFPLRRLLQELQGELRGRDSALQELHLSLHHHDAQDTALTVRTTTPQRDATRLFALVRETLERTTLPEPVTDILLTIDRFVAPDIAQVDLFDQRAQQDSGWSGVLDKLRARLGDRAVKRLGLRDDHRPERAWCVLDSPCGSTADLGALPDRPLWIFNEPQPLQSVPKVIGTPERIEAGWWDSEDTTRDYYIGRSTQGARWWLFREVATQRWFLHGVWA